MKDKSQDITFPEQKIVEINLEKEMQTAILIMPCPSSWGAPCRMCGTG